MRQGSDKEKDHRTEQYSEIQDANMQEAHKCKKCGEMFPANQLQLKCAGFADSGKHVAEPAPSVARSKALPHLQSQVILNYLLQVEEVNQADSRLEWMKMHLDTTNLLK